MCVFLAGKTINVFTAIKTTDVICQIIDFQRTCDPCCYCVVLLRCPPPHALVAQSVKKLSAMPETWVQSLGQEDPLEEEMATHSVFLHGVSHGQKSLVRYSPCGCKETDTTERLTLFTAIRFLLPSKRYLAILTWALRNTC